MTTRLSVSVGIALVAALVLGSLASGALVAQSQAPAVLPAQHLTIQQNGFSLGTVDVPAGVQVGIGTIYSDYGQPINDVLLRIVVANGRPPVVVHIPRASVTSQTVAAN